MLPFASSSDWLQRFLIGQNISIDFFNQLKAKPIGIALDARFFPAPYLGYMLASSSDWLNSVFFVAVIGQQNSFSV